MVLALKYGLPIVGLICLATAIPFSVENPPQVWDEDTPLQEVLSALGEAAPAHTVEEEESLMWVKRGEDLVKSSRTVGPDGKVTPYISKHFLCTHCHNIDREDPDLRSRDPEARLDYAIEHQMPFLQGTTFQGIVNRESWYNDDYVKKYGEAVDEAHLDLRKSIQLCAVQCSQGRSLDSWEIDAILVYFWTLQFKLGDLDLSDIELNRLNYLAEATQFQDSLVSLLKSKYLQTSPAHFGDAPADKRTGYGLTGNVDRGRAIYNLSCLHCHKEGTVSSYVLDHSILSFKHLKRKIPKDSHFSLYQIIRYGTYSIPGHRPYMPHYPLERMSNQQIEDLRSYIEMMSL